MAENVTQGGVWSSLGSAESEVFVLSRWRRLSPGLWPGDRPRILSITGLPSHGKDGFSSGEERLGENKGDHYPQVRERTESQK